MKLYDDFERWKSMVSSTKHSDLAGIILDESGYTAMWQSDKSPDAPGRLENLKELVSSMEEFESLDAFLEHISLVMENQNNMVGEQITIMTLHGAKGLEFDAVFLPGWEEGLFPSQRSMDENGLKGLEEERRLAYVGITRARKKSHISYAANRRMYGSWINAIPSRFVDELPEEHIETQSELGLHGNTGRSSHWDSSGSAETNFVRKTSFITGVSKLITEKTEATSIAGYQRGDKVMHQKFGKGTVVNVDGAKLDIAFETGGTKRVLDSFITKA
jgi:DNA helicase-2/ATP-dependent DNA helicase PcrA